MFKGNGCGRVGLHMVVLMCQVQRLADFCLTVLQSRFASDVKTLQFFPASPTGMKY